MKLERVLQLAAAMPPAVILQGVVRQRPGHHPRPGPPRRAVGRPRPQPERARLPLALRRRPHLPGPATDEEAFLHALEELGRRLPQRGVIFPTHDEYVWAVSRNRERLLPLFHIPFSGWETMARVADKEQQMRAAWRAGVDTPTTVFVRGAEDLQDGAAPGHLPGHLQAGRVRSSSGASDARCSAESPDSLAEAWQQVDGCGTLMLQEIVPGGDDELYTVGSYLDERSRPLAVFTGRKLRQHPRTFGTARFAESVWIDDLADAGLRLLTELRYHGVSQVEFKRDPRDGGYKLMEVNARHWLWHSLATACGVNLSLVAYRDAIGDPYVAPRQADGRRWILALKDVHRQHPRDDARRALAAALGGVARRHARRRRPLAARPRARRRQHLAHGPPPGAPSRRGAASKEIEL